jgi:hypothetical protein
MCGQREFSVDQLKSYTIYDGYKRDDSTIRYFWEWLYKVGIPIVCSARTQAGIERRSTSLLALRDRLGPGARARNERNAIEDHAHDSHTGQR